MERVLITGVSRGIGHGFARGYLNAGAKVFGTVRDLEGEGVRSLQKEFPERFTPLVMDVSDRRTVSKAAAELSGRAEALDIVINNAGTNTYDNERRVEDISEENLSRVFDVNTVGPLRVLQEFYPLLKKGTKPRAVMISSTAGSIEGQGGGRVVPYCVSKAALNMLTKLLYFHCKEDGVVTVAIHPGWVRTDMGGSGGALSVEESVSGMMQVIEAQTFDAPLYVDYRGEELPW